MQPLAETQQSADKYNRGADGSSSKRRRGIKNKTKKLKQLTIAKSREQHHIRRVSPCGAGGQSNNVTLCSRRPVHPSDSPCYGLGGTNNKAKRLKKYSDFSIEIKGAERHQTTPEQGCARYQVLGYPYRGSGIGLGPVNGHQQHERRHEST